MRCGWCLEFGHPAECCPKASPFVHGHVAEPRTDADDAMDQLRDRFLKTRTFAGQLYREMRQAGVTPTPETMALNPDPFDE